MPLTPKLLPRGPTVCRLCRGPCLHEQRRMMPRLRQLAVRLHLTPRRSGQ